MSIVSGSSNAESMRERQSERLSALEVSVDHLDSELQGVKHEINESRHELREGFALIRRQMSDQKQPLTAFAGWASVILALVYAFGSPLQSTDTRIEQRIDRMDARLMQQESSGTSKIVAEKLASMREEVEENEAEALRERQEDMVHISNLFDAKLEHLRDLVDKNTKETESLDGVLQREMRLLDEVLQREMGLHVDRLDALIKEHKSRDAERKSWFSK